MTAHKDRNATIAATSATCLATALKQPSHEAAILAASLVTLLVIALEQPLPPKELSGFAEEMAD